MGGFLVKYVEGEPVSYLKGDFQGTINNLAEHWGVRAGEFVVTTHSGSVLNLQTLGRLFSLRRPARSSQGKEPYVFGKT